MLVIADASPLSIMAYVHICRSGLTYRLEDGAYTHVVGALDHWSVTICRAMQVFKKGGEYRNGFYAATTYFTIITRSVWAGFHLGERVVISVVGASRNVNNRQNTV